MHSSKGSAVMSDLDAAGLGACTEDGVGVPPEVGIGINLAMWNQWCVSVRFIGRALEPNRVQQKNVWPNHLLKPAGARVQGAHHEKLHGQRCGN